MFRALDVIRSSANSSPLKTQNKFQSLPRSIRGSIFSKRFASFSKSRKSGTHPMTGATVSSASRTSDLINSFEISATTGRYIMKVVLYIVYRYILLLT